MTDGLRKQLIGEAATAPVREFLLVATMLPERAARPMHGPRIPVSDTSPAHAMGNAAQ